MKESDFSICLVNLSVHSVGDEGGRKAEHTKKESDCLILTSIQIDSTSDFSMSFLLT